jgi:YidC/Oxa1 family membrane protein insertase
MKQKKLILLILIIPLLISGCNNYLVDQNKKMVTDSITGQKLRADILCQPTNKAIKEEYKKYSQYNSLELESLPSCKDIKIISNKNETLWNTLFVIPIAFIITKIGSFFGNYGLGLIITTLLIRGVLFPLSQKTALQSENIGKAKPELEKLEEKYKDKKDQESMMKKNQEMLLIYKKYKVNPISGCLFSFVQLPLLFAFLEAINRVPAIFEGKFLGLKMGLTPLYALKIGSYHYIILIILIVLTTYYSFKLNSSSAAISAEQKKQTEFMMKFSIIMIGFVSFSLPTAISIYWIASNLFTVIQNLIVKRRK